MPVAKVLDRASADPSLGGFRFRFDLRAALNIGFVGDVGIWNTGHGVVCASKLMP
jgi:hypothetical protein